MFAVAFVLIGLGRAVPGFAPSWWMLGLAAALAVLGAARAHCVRPGGCPCRRPRRWSSAPSLLAAEAARLLAGFLVVATGLLDHTA